ncbi:hypothetical protein V1478_010576, partial [Vespula squamosa]
LFGYSLISSVIGRRYACNQKDKGLKYCEVLKNSSPKTRCIKHSSGVHYLLTVCKRSSSSQPPPSSSSPSSSPSPYHRSHHHHEYRHLSMVFRENYLEFPS